MRQRTYIEMERYSCGMGRAERIALWLLIAFCIFGSGAAIALAWGFIEYPGSWPL